jgi:putative hemolysin
MKSIVVEVIAVLCMIAVNGFFALAEMAVVSSRHARLRRPAEDGKKSYQLALRLAQDTGNFLSTIQIGITLIGTLAGAFGGATVAAAIDEALQDVPLLAPYSTTIGIATVVIAITYLSVSFGELVPKRIALANPEKIAAFIAYPIRGVSFLFLPVVRILSGTTGLVLRILGVPEQPEPAITEEEIRMLMREGRRRGIFEQDEQRMVEAVFRLDERNAEAIATPRNDMVWITRGDNQQTIRARVDEHPDLAFLPVCGDDIDNLVGVVSVRRLLTSWLDESFDRVESIMEQPVVVPETLDAFKVLDTFRKRKTDVVFVVDEYGGIQGQITLQNILEEITGELVASGRPQPVRKRPDGAYVVEASWDVEEFATYFSIEREVPEERDYNTVAGLVLHRLGVIPHPGMGFRMDDLRVQVATMEGNRIESVIVKSS